MSIPLSPRYILASVVALTLSHAAFAQGTQCGGHIGNLVAHGITSTHFGTAYVTPAGVGKLFHWDSKGINSKSLGAQFAFNGCKGSGVFVLYCMDTMCDPSGSAVAATRSTGNNLNQWAFWNAGREPLWFPMNSDTDTVYSAYWTWNVDDTLRPVTYNRDATPQGVLWDVQYGYLEDGAISFGVSSGSNTLTWESL